jgi:transcriptional regulator with XRE-family HTH domain
MADTGSLPPEAVPTSTRVGVGHTYLSAVEQGKATPSLELLVRLARVLEVGIEELFERGGRAAPPTALIAAPSSPSSSSTSSPARASPRPVRSGPAHPFHK